MADFLITNFLIIALLSFMAFIIVASFYSIMVCNSKQYRQLTQELAAARAENESLKASFMALSNVLNDRKAIDYLERANSKPDRDARGPRLMRRSDKDEKQIEDDNEIPAVEQYH